MPGAEIKYLSGFGGSFESEALPGALPNHNSPQKCPYGLYSEQISGTAFTAPRSHNLRSWVFRIQPSVSHTPYAPTPTLNSHLHKGDDSLVVTPNQIRWSPFPLPPKSTSGENGSVKDGTTFVTGLKTVAAAGGAATRNGLAVLVYGANKSMENQAFYSADGDLLIVPQEGRLHIRTELGLLHAEPTEIVIIPRGIKFAVELPDGPSRGYILETYENRHWELPDLGPIGANGLANPRDFHYPSADFVHPSKPCEIIAKFGGTLHSFSQKHTPFDVVAWHGNYAPFKYDLKRFNTINTVSFDHPDPSIFTVLTLKGDVPGVAIADFVIFPPRWMVAENTFRPPWFHRNCMSEFMGLITGSYDAKQGGFLPGGGSLHSAFTAHGPDTATFLKASKEELKPVKIGTGSLAFMFETSLMLSVSKWALEEAPIQHDYLECWQEMPVLFDGTPEGKKL
ncbi:homogentisate 1,2-dioxygenase [Zopfochytrium polystomum]|nr:homogentisate 1,2-dioxygenase [Zopfochytrium polystomum]